MRTIYLMMALMLASASAWGQSTTVRILFYTGNVTVRTANGSAKAAIGTQLGAKDEVTIASGGTLQLSVNGKVIKYNQPAKLKVADAIKRAGNGENAAVANTVRTLASASGADRSRRSSQAGATRLDDSSHLIADAKDHVIHDARDMANQELTERTGIDNPLDKVESAVRALAGADDMIILEPRSTAVPSGPVRLRWLRSPTAGGYTISVKNYLGDEIFSRQTNDTEIVWADSKLPPEEIFTWTLTDSKNTLHNAGAYFHRLNDSTDAAVRAGESAIRKELGDDNPALPLVLGEYYSDNGCHGAAARYFTSGAAKSTQHYQEFMGRACDQYQFEMNVPADEIQLIYRK
ncbi:MAG: hypothetical protein ABIR47_10150 [Candidatus Kapaibacterium sp.]